MIFSLLDQVFRGFFIKTMRKILFLSKSKNIKTKNSKKFVLAHFSLVASGQECRRPKIKEFLYFHEIPILQGDVNVIQSPFQS